MTHKEGLARNVGVYGIATILNQALPFLLIPVLTRYLAPAEYGYLSIFFVSLWVSQALVGVSMVNNISKAFFIHEKDHLARVFPNLLIFLFITTAAVFSVVVVGVRWWSGLLGIPSYWLLLIPLISAFFVIHQANCTLVRNLKKPVQFGAFEVSSTVVNLGVSLFLIIALGWGWEGRAVGVGAAYGFAAVVGFLNLTRKGYWSPNLDKAILKDIALVTLPLIPNSVFGIVVTQSGKLFVNAGFDKADVGLFTVGQQIAMIVFYLGQAFTFGWGPFVFEHLSKERPESLLRIARAAVAFAGGILLVAVTVFAGAGLVLRIMTTPEYFGAKQFVGWFSAGFALLAVYSLFPPLLIHRNRQHHIAWISGIGACVNLTLNWILIRLWGLPGAAVSFFLTYLLMFILMFLDIQRFYDLPWRRAIRIGGWIEL